MAKNKDPFSCRYEDLKPRYQNLIRENFYFSTLLCCDESMFEYENLPASINPKFLEDYLNLAGAAGIGKADDGSYLVCVAPGREGEIDQYGDPVNMESVTENGIPVTGRIGEDVAIIYNNSARSVQLDIIMDADNFSQIDKSSGINVKLSRIAPLFAVSDDTVKEGLKQAIEHILEGEIDTVVSPNVFEALAMGAGADQVKQLLTVTEPEKIQYIQYLSRYYDDLMRRHFARRGLSLHTGTKAAQQTVDEINGMDSVSWYMPINKLKARQQGFDMFNRIFGENVQVHFSEIWQQEYDAYKIRKLRQDIDAEEAAALTEDQTDKEEVQENADDAQNE